MNHASQNRPRRLCGYVRPHDRRQGDKLLLSAYKGKSRGLSVISESYYWKRELIEFSGQFNAWSPLYACAADDGGWDDEARFQLERCVFYPALIIRKLVECKKITDKLRDQKTALHAFPSKLKGPTKLLHLYGSDDITTEYDLENPELNDFDAWQLASEIVHSLTLTFYLSEPMDRVEGVFVASQRNNWSRLVKLPADTWFEILRQFSADDITEAHAHFSTDGKIEAILK